MQINARQAEKLFSEDYKFQQVGFAMMLARLKWTYSQDRSADALCKAVDEINTFLDKFKGLMTDDDEIISKL